MSQEYTGIDWLNAMLPPQVPKDWRVAERRNDGVSFLKGELQLDLAPSAKPHGALGVVPNLGVIITGVMAGNLRWVHAIVCQRDARPTIDQCEMVKDDFFGPRGTMMAAIFPAAWRESLELEMRHTVHLLGCLDCAVMPRFDSGLAVGGFDFKSADLLAKFEKGD